MSHPDFELSYLRRLPPVVLHLANTDMLTPQNFTLEDPDSEPVVDVPAGKTAEVHLMPLWPGRYTLYCSNKLLFMDSQRKKGMKEKRVVVTG